MLHFGDLQKFVKVSNLKPESGRKFARIWLDYAKIRSI
ncbi:hypothetical protein FM102_11275 [Corynebacterium glutamicum]|nr:hypothetical protein FM102_11275 [Corynebacterium glutamicum]